MADAAPAISSSWGECSPALGNLKPGCLGQKEGTHAWRRRAIRAARAAAKASLWCKELAALRETYSNKAMRPRTGSPSPGRGLRLAHALGQLDCSVEQ